MEQNFVEFEKKRDFSQVINATFDFIRQEFKPFLKAIALYSGPLILITSIVIGLYTANFFDRSTIQTAMSFSSGKQILVFLMSFLSNLFLLTTVYSYINLYIKKGKGGFTFDEIWLEIKQHILKFFLAGFILGLLYLGVSLLGFVMIFVSLPILGFLLIIIPLMFTIVKSSLIYPSLLFEKLSFSAAFSRSFFLTKNHWWVTLGIILTSVFIIASYAMVIVIIQYIFLYATYLNKLATTSNSGIQSMSMVIIMTVWNLLITMLYSILYTSLSIHYFNLVERKEYPKLKQKLQTIYSEETNEVNMN